MKKLFYILIACFFLTSCDDFDEDININPNRPSDATAMQLIANSQLTLPSLSSSPNGEFLAQYLSETQYVNASLYPVSSSSFYSLYQGPLMNLEYVLTRPELVKEKDGPAANQLAVAKIMKAYYFWHITDRWGDVPYMEALQGTDNLTPKYDTQESIYNAMFTLLQEANSQIVAGSISSDIMYSGDMQKWRKLANTLRMLMALRLSEVNPTKAQEEFNQALTAGIMASNADNFIFKHQANADNQNYWYGQIDPNGLGREWWALSQTLVENMKPYNDPRLPVYGNPTRSNGDYVGLPSGETQNMDTEKYSLLGNAIWKQNAPVYLVTYAEALFAKAEAAKRGWITGGETEAEANYNTAIRQSVAQWVGNAAAADAFLAKPGVAYTSANGLEQIATQRWVHLFMHGYQAWAEWRRTGYPDNLIAPNGVNVPTRQIYVETEKFNNTANYNEAVQRQFGGQDGLYGKLWWDK